MSNTSASGAVTVRRRNRTAMRVLQYLGLAAAVVWSLAPIYWMLATSLKGELEATQLDPTLVPHAPTLANYTGWATGDLPVMQFFLNSVVTGLAAAVVAVVFPMPAADDRSRGRLRARFEGGTHILLVHVISHG